MHLPGLVQPKSDYRHRSGPRPRSSPNGFAFVRARRRLGIIMLSMSGLCLGIMLGAIAYYGLVQEREKPAARTIVVEKIAPLEMADVLVPTTKVDEGTALHASLFMKVRRPKIGLPPNAIESFDQIRGGYAKAALLPNYPIQGDFVTQEKAINAVAANIPSGFRAVTINVNATSSVEGWARAGAHVDLHWVNDVLGERTATLLVRNALVLSAERQAETAGPATGQVPTTVTLLATEVDAQKISLASSSGSLVLHLRGSADNGKLSSSVSTISFKDLLGKSGQPEGADDIEGVARMRSPDGTMMEWAISRGRLMSRHR